MNAPRGDPAIFTSDYGFEKKHGRVEIAYATPRSVYLMKDAKLKGIRIYPKA